MEIINLESRTWELMMTKFEEFAEKMAALCSTDDQNKPQWLDNQDVCQLLHISKRTLQTYRDNGKIAYTQIRHKMYYRTEDVKKLINNPKNK